MSRNAEFAAIAAFETAIDESELRSRQSRDLFLITAY
jgi:hypothetical protein